MMRLNIGDVARTDRTRASIITADDRVDRANEKIRLCVADDRARSASRPRMVASTTRALHF
jgi:hypothetical protein